MNKVPLYPLTSELIKYLIKLSISKLNNKGEIIPSCLTPFTSTCITKKSARPWYEGQLNSMAEPIPLVIRPLVRPLDDHHYFAADRRRRRCTLILMQFEARGVHLPWAPYDQLLAPQDELPS